MFVVIVVYIDCLYLNGGYINCFEWYCFSIYLIFCDFIFDVLIIISCKMI